MNDKYFKILIKLAQIATKKDEVPVAALIVKNNKIVAKAYNKKNNIKNPLLHAEVIAIKKATKKIKDWRLTDCDLYVTLEPCAMCSALIKEARITNVYYLLNNVKKVKHRTSFVKVCSKLTNEYENMIKNFFKTKR